jgi:protein involved in polysaccharide export with SLBB domain
VVLGFRPNAAGVDSIPGIQLEDGDRFVVPSVPADVNVIGAVYNQSSFLYGRSPRVGTYLHMAGGPNRSADSQRIFIIRADGEVINKAEASGPWKGDFKNIRLYPGDTIVVPDKTFRGSGARNFLNWTQTISQLAIGGALVGSVVP